MKSPYSGPDMDAIIEVGSHHQSLRKCCKDFEVTVSIDWLLIVVSMYDTAEHNYICSSMHKLVFIALQKTNTINTHHTFKLIQVVILRCGTCVRARARRRIIFSITCFRRC